MLCRLTLGLVVIQTRRSGHVQTLFPFDEIIVVHFRECRFVFTRQRHTCCPVRFITDDQIELAITMLDDFFLRTRNHFDGLVGREHDGQSVIAVLLDVVKLVQDVFGLGRCG